MVEYQIMFNRNAFSVRLQNENDAIPAGYVNIGSFLHHGPTDPLGSDTNHVMYHHIRDALYHQGVQSMQAMTFTLISGDESVSYTIAPITTNTNTLVASGSVIASITGVPPGQTPVISPADGRFVIAGDEGSGWKLARGMSAISIGTFNGTVSAPGAVSGTVTLMIAAPFTPFTVTVGDSGEWIGFSDGDIVPPPFNPPVGSISNEPYTDPAHTLTALWDDNGTGNLVAVFNGDMTELADGLVLRLGGMTHAFISASSFIGGTTKIEFDGAGVTLADGQAYTVHIRPITDSVTDPRPGYAGIPITDPRPGYGGVITYPEGYEE